MFITRLIAIAPALFSLSAIEQHSIVYPSWHDLQNPETHCDGDRQLLLVLQYTLPQDYPGHNGEREIHARRVH